MQKIEKEMNKLRQVNFMLGFQVDFYLTQRVSLGCTYSMRLSI